MLPGAPSGEVIGAYQASVTELKFRLRAIDNALDGRLHLPSIFVREFSYLQLRMCCELLALSCVIAHDNLTEQGARRLLKEYHAGKIMAVLNGLHPEFFPEHIDMRFNVTPGHHEVIEVEQEGVTREGLASLYARCGAALHRGSASSFMKRAYPQIEKDYRDIRSELKKFRRLLSGCAMRSSDKSYTLICSISWDDDKPAEIRLAVAQPYAGEWPHGGH